MKKLGKLLAVIFVMVFLVSMTTFASETESTETCSFAKEGETCEIWWFFNNQQHWRACVTHRDSSGNDIIVTDPVDHEFVDGICTVCERPETSGISKYSYLFVILVVFVIGMMITNKYKSPKLGRDDVTTFGLDKFRKF